MQIISSKEIMNLVNSFSVNDLKNIFKNGTKFRIAIDNDVWHIIGTVPDSEKYLIVIYKSWSKHKQHWVYKASNAISLLWELAYLDEIYRDKNNNIAIVDNKNKS